MQVRRKITLFDWDRGNRDKNWKKHGVADGESEEAFFDSAKRILKDTLHSGSEPRYILVGQTRRRRLLYIVFTIRQGAIRIISARDLNTKERGLYEEKA